MSIVERDLLERDLLEEQDLTEEQMLAPQPNDGQDERGGSDASPPPPPTNAPSLALVTATAFLSSAAAGWAAGGLFAGGLARSTGIIAAAFGAGAMGFAQRSRKPTIWQLGTIAAIGIIGMLFSLTGGGHGVVSAIADAIRGGGPSGTSLPFDSGWRLLIVVLVAALASGSASIALATRRARLAVLIPVPALIGAGLVQPHAAALLSGVVAMALLLSSLVVSYSVELAASGASDRRFEARRIMRGVAGIAAVAVLLVVTSHSRVLFPVPNHERVIPPQLPPPGIALPDRVLFTVQSDAFGPWRLGVLDVYDGTAWRLPPFDPARPLRVHSGETLAGTATPSPKSTTATFRMSGLPGSVLPNIAGAISLTANHSLELTFDPRTQMLRSDAATNPAGATYTITAAVAPSGHDLAQAGPPTPAMNEFMRVPQPPPPGVTALLAKAPAKPLWNRLQFVRFAFYAKVVASGQGKPVAVPPSRVDEILSGKPASPFEISAAETLLARWAGVPARIGYGFFEGERKDGIWSVKPQNAATWIEAWFTGYGWVPVVGVPPRAKSSLDQQQKQSNQVVRPTEQLALVLYVPIRVQSLRGFYFVARFWFLVTMPLLLVLFLAWAFYPGAVKLARRARRARWAGRNGLAARIAVAYANLRDAATDFNIGLSSETPMEFARTLAADDELTELSWLVTRALWGDLRRDLRAEDAAAAERLAKSVTRRMSRAQPGTSRILAIASRASLRDPYTREMPNLWSARRVRVLGIATVIALALSSCGVAPAATRVPGSVLPSRIVPPSLNETAFEEEPKVEQRLGGVGRDALIDAVRVFTFRNAQAVQGYIEVGEFSPGISGLMPDVRRGVLQGIGASRFSLTRLGHLRVYTAVIGQEDFTVWFAPEGTSFELMVSRRTFARSLELLAAVLDYQGRRVGTLGGTTTVTLVDPRRGQDI